MPSTVVVGAQWGDEAKGKIVDYLAGKAAMVVRYGGGSNAGHTVTVDGVTYKFHLVPCGILHDGVTCVIGDGVVIDPTVLLAELDGLNANGVTFERLHISGSAHVIMPYHKLQDVLEEKRRGNSAIGTTGRGIGPAYADKAARTGIRMHEFIVPEVMEARVREQLEFKNALVTRVYGGEPLDADAVIAACKAEADRLRPLVCNTSALVGATVKSGVRIVFEGAQGAMLDIDAGTYPFVTSSHPIAGGACLGTGIGPCVINGVVGVAKGYTTRVGAGVFPTELLEETGHYIRERGHEYGTTTGRPRRCGWLDTVVLRHSAQINGMTALAVGHVDVLAGLGTVKIATAYRVDGEVVTDLPVDLAHAEGIEPIYEELPGWADDNIAAARTLADLPANCVAYIRRVEALVGVPVASVSVGPGRDELIIVRPELLEPV